MYFVFLQIQSNVVYSDKRKQFYEDTKETFLSNQSKLIFVDFFNSLL